MPVGKARSLFTDIPPTGNWRWDIQNLRGIAILVVVLYHAKLPVPGGFVGVDVFFVISGYVITASVLRRVKNGNFSAKDFYWRRFRRLVPALSVLVSAVLIASFFLESPIDEQTNTGWMAVGAILSFSNLVAYLAPEGYFFLGLSPNPLLNTWSLSVEEQFYFGFTFIAVLIGMLVKRTQWSLQSKFMLILTGALLASFLVNVAASFRTPGTLTWIPTFINQDFAFYSPFTRAWEFGLGILLATSGWTIKNKRLSLAGAIAGCSMIIGTSLLLTKETVFPGLIVVIPVLGTFLVILADRSSIRSQPQRLGSLALNQLGNVSYSWYLWHWPAIVFAVSLFGGDVYIAVVAACLSLIPAWLSLKYIESPNRRVEWKALPIKAAPFIKWLAPPLVLASALIILSTNYWFSPDIRNMAEQTNAASLAVNCTEFIADFGIGSQVCTWPSSGTGEPVYLVGDSVAAQYANTLKELAESVGRPLTVATHPACPFLGVNLYYNHSGQITDDIECQTANLEFSKTLSASPSGLVILASSSVPFYSDSRAVGFREEEPSTGIEEKAEILNRGLESLIDELSLSGHSVSIIQSTPEFFVREGAFDPIDQWNSGSCFGTALMNVSTDCGTSRSIQQLNAYQGPSRAAIENVATSKEVQILDPRDKLCGRGLCETNMDNSWWFRDGVHLGKVGVEHMRPELKTLLG